MTDRLRGQSFWTKSLFFFENPKQNPGWPDLSQVSKTATTSLLWKKTRFFFKYPKNNASLFWTIMMSGFYLDWHIWIEKCFLSWSSIGYSKYEPHNFFCWSSLCLQPRRSPPYQLLYWTCEGFHEHRSASIPAKPHLCNLSCLQLTQVWLKKKNNALIKPGLSPA